ncbi:MAG: transporter substrate-binding domain-containing protein [Thermodesulfobacteriota bacterium]|nr:transporter substrate-binding domain-containing protein [Thermodesulfobacteriota bacterium]
MVVTEDWPPFNYEKDGQIAGFATEIVRKTLEKSKLNVSFKIYPWARAYQMALEDKNILIYTISRNKERENHFKWIGPFADRSIFLYKLSLRQDISIESLEDVKKYKTGLMRKDATHQFFMDKGFLRYTHFEITSKEDHNIKKLLKGRIDLIAGNEIALAYKYRELGFNFNMIGKVFPLIESGGYWP